MIEGRPKWDMILLIFVAPVAMAVLLAWIMDQWAFVPTMLAFYLIGWTGRSWWQHRMGYGLFQARGECPVAGESCYVAVAGNPTVVGDMVWQHLREKHEILPGVTDR